MTKPTGPNYIGTETDPIHEYDHSNGNQWVCGGYVYRGNDFPEYNGHYIFSDGSSRKIWALDMSGTPPYNTKVEIANSPASFNTMGEDQDGEIYLGTGTPRKLEPGISNSGVVANGTYYIRVRHSGKYLNVEAPATNNGDNFEQNSFTGDDAQKFIVNHLGGGEYVIQNVNSGKVLDVQGFGTGDGANIHQWGYGNQTNQKWIIEWDEATFFRIKGVGSGKDVEVAGSSNADGANVQIWTRTGADNQEWEFIPVSGGGPISPDVSLPATLSQTGAFSDLANLTPSAGIIPYDMITSLWSDGAEKFRWLAVPNDGSHNSPEEDVIWSEEGEWDFPEGTVFIKHFDLPTDENNPGLTRKMETRFLIKGVSGYYAVTYKWRADGSDADLLETSDQVDVTIQESGGGTRTQTWYYPSRSECFICHTEASGRVLGPKTRHLNKDILYPTTSTVGNQVETYNHIGMFDQTLDPQDIPGFLTAAEIDDTNASLEDRARSYLDINCSSCHRPNGGTRADWNALLTEDLANANIIDGDVIEDLGISGAKVIVPGDTAKSVLYQRLRQVGTGTAMPPLAKNVAHDEGVALIRDWILSMAGPSLTMKVFLEGPYDQGTGEMDDNLREFDLLTTTDPYCACATAASNAFDPAGSNSIVDWMVIRLRNKNDNTQIVTSKVVLVQKDGDIVDENLNPTIVFEGTPLDSYFVEIQHYNHLGAMTNAAIDLSTSPLIDFSSPATDVYTDGAEAFNTIGGVRAMWSGDANKSSSINAIDKNLNWFPENGGVYDYGTTTADFNLNGTVNSLDLNLYWKINNSRVAQLP